MQRPIAHSSSTATQRDILDKVSHREYNLSRSNVRSYFNAEKVRFRKKYPGTDISEIEPPDLSPKAVQEVLPILWDEGGIPVWYYVDIDRAGTVLDYLDNQLVRDTEVAVYVDSDWETLTLYANSHIIDDPVFMELERQQRAYQETGNVDLVSIIQSAVSLATTQQQESIMDMLKRLTSSEATPQTSSSVTAHAIYDVTNPEVMLPLRVEELAQHQYPTTYEEYHERKDYDPLNWTWSLRSNTPYYVLPESTPVSLYDERVAVTSAVNRVWSSARYQERFNNSRDANYLERQPAQVIREITSRLNAIHGQLPRERASIHDVRHAGYLPQAQLASTLNTFIPNPELIPIVIQRMPRQDSLTVRTFSELYPENVTINTRLNRDVWFDGMLTDYLIEVHTEVNTVNEFLQVVKEMLAKVSMMDVKRHGNKPPPLIYSVQAYFTTKHERGSVTDEGDNAGDGVGGEKKVGFWKGLTSDVKNVTSAQLTVDFEETLDNLGYADVKTSGNSFTLDMSRFVVRRLDLTRSGSGRTKVATRLKKIEDILAKKRISSFHDFHGISDDLSWATIYGVKTRTINMCFQHALNYFLKEHGMRPKGGKHTDGHIVKGYDVRLLVKENARLIRLNKSPINVLDACDIGTEFGLHTYVYGVNGDLLASKDSTVNPMRLKDGVWEKVEDIPDEDRTMRLLLADNHYVNITKLKERPQRLYSGKRVKKGRYIQKIGYYDIETIVKGTEVTPYSNAYKVCCSLDSSDDGVGGISIHPIPSRRVFDDMIGEILHYGPGYHHYLTAYNGSAFDHVVLLRYLIERNARVVKAPNPHGKGQSFTVRLKTAKKSEEWLDAEIKRRVEEWKVENPLPKYDPTLVSYAKASQTKDIKGYEKKLTKAAEKISATVRSETVLISVWDPVLFVRSSLKDAAVSYKLNIEKEPFDHDEIQAIYQAGLLESWIDQHEDELTKYNIRDVELLRKLIMKLFDALEDITKFSRSELVRTVSISSLAYKWWSGLTNHGTVAVKNEGIDKLIRSALVAGRTEGVIGHHLFPKFGLLIDVVSLYPTVMFLNKFPTGKEHVIYDLEQSIRSYEEGTLGLYYVKWDQSTLRTRHPILPTRNPKSGLLDWKSKSSGEGYLPNVTIDQLKQYGAKVEFVIPSVLTPITIKQTFTHDDLNKRVVSASEVATDMNANVQRYIDREGLENVVIRKHLVNVDEDPFKKNPSKKEWITVNSTKEVLVCAVTWPQKQNSEKAAVRATDDTDNADEPNRPFQNYVTLLRDLKNKQDEYEASGDPRYNAALREMIKMLLNALSGKVIQRNFDRQFMMVVGVDQLYKRIVNQFGILDEDNLRTLVDNYQLDVDPIARDSDGNEYANVTWRESVYSVTHSKPSQLGIFIYAYARAYMYEHVFSRMTVWYSDTDSAFISLEEFDNKVPKQLKCLDVGRNYELVKVRDKEFGDLEIDTKSKGKVFLFDAITVISPKTYALWRDGVIVRHRCKGVKQKDKFVDSDGEVKSIIDNLEAFYNLLASRLSDKTKTDIHTDAYGRYWGSGLGVSKNLVVKQI